MAADDPVTLGEVYRLLQDTREDVRIIDGKVDGLKEQRLPARVQALETAVSWVVRIVVGTVMAAVLGLVLATGGIVPWPS